MLQMNRALCIAPQCAIAAKQDANVNKYLKVQILQYFYFRTKIGIINKYIKNYKIPIFLYIHDEEPKKYGRCF